MAPKGKKGKKGGDDDWEAELGESIAPVNGDAAPADAADGDKQDDDAPAGGLMAMMSRRREKRKKQGLSDDFEGPKDDEPAAEATPAPPAQEANMDDEFAMPEKKGKGGKGGKGAAAAKPAAGGDDLGEDGRILTKAEKEKLKKEREKARKKEQVRNDTAAPTYPKENEQSMLTFSSQGQEEDTRPGTQGRAREACRRGEEEGGRACTGSCCRRRQEGQEAASSPRSPPEAAGRAAPSPRGRGACGRRGEGTRRGRREARCRRDQAPGRREG